MSETQKPTHLTEFEQLIADVLEAHLRRTDRDMARCRADALAQVLALKIKRAGFTVTPAGDKERESVTLGRC